MAELLRAAVRCVDTPSLLPRERHLLAEIAQRADDSTEPQLGADGTVRQGRVGYVHEIYGGKSDLAGQMQSDMIQSYLVVFEATGWLQAVTDPARDGAYQLNVRRLNRLAQAAENGVEPRDEEEPGDFSPGDPEGFAERVDRLLVR